jgi:hypothetical protein
MKHNLRSQRIRRKLKNRRWLDAIVFLVLCLISPSAWCWDRIGHRVAAEMAEARLSSQALAAIHYLLGPGVTLADISTWADEQHGIQSSGPWHHVDVPNIESHYDRRAKTLLRTPLIFFHSHNAGNSLPMITAFKNALAVTQTSKVGKKP